MAGWDLPMNQQNPAKETSHEPTSGSGTFGYNRIHASFQGYRIVADSLVTSPLKPLSL
jgi:hypothetical protein